MSSHLVGASWNKPGPRVPIIRVTGTEKQRFTIVSPACFGQRIHWHGNRSHECVKDFKAVCEGCEKGWAEKWKGYLDAIRWHTSIEERCFLEITWRAYELIVQLAEKDQSLRGLVIGVAKTKGGAKGRYLIEVQERRIVEANLPQPADPLPILRKLWLSKDQYMRERPDTL